MYSFGEYRQFRLRCKSCVFRGTQAQDLIPEGVTPILGAPLTARRLNERIGLDDGGEINGGDRS